MRTLSLIAMVLTFSVARPDTIVAITQDAKVYTVDTVTGAQTLVSDYDFTDVRGLTLNPLRGFFYFVDHNNLYHFTLGGQPTWQRVLEFVGPNGTMGDIAGDRFGAFYGIESIPNSSDKMWRFTLDSGNHLVGETPFNGQLDFGADGSLYQWVTDANQAVEGLYVVDRKTGGCVKIGNAGNPPDLTAFCTLDTFNDAFAQATDGPLYSVRLFTGAASPIGGPNIEFRGAAHGIVKKEPAYIQLGTVNYGRTMNYVDGCLSDRDHDLMRICKFIVPNASVPPIRFEVNVNGEANPALFDAIWRARMNVGGGFEMAVQAKRISTGVFDTLATTPLATPFSIGTLVNQDALPYLSRQGGIGTFRVEVRQTGPTAAPVFCLELDQFAVTNR